MYKKFGILGGVLIILWSGTAICTTVVDLADPSVWKVKVNGYETDDGTGWDLARGDVNNDGYDDLIIGGHPGNGDKGKAYILYGRPSFSGIFNMTTDADVVIQTSESDRFGAAIDCRNINQDGYDDLFVGGYLGDGVGNSYRNWGEASIIWGELSLPGTINMPGDADVFLYLSKGTDANLHPHFGDRVTSGDINGDGDNDLVICAGGKDRIGESGSDAGMVTVIYGSGFSGNIDMTSQNDVCIYAPDPSDVATSGAMYEALAIGDVDNDGCDDIIWGLGLAKGENNAHPNAGELHIIFGSNSLSSIIDLKTYSHTVIYGQDADDYACELHKEMADINGDGYDDILVAAPGADGAGNSRPDCGEAYVIFGRATWPSVMKFENDADIIFYGKDPGDGIEKIIYSDWNWGGGEEFILGSPGGDGVGNLRSDCGEVSTLKVPLVSGTTVDLASASVNYLIIGEVSGDRLAGGILTLVTGKFEGSSSQRELAMGTFLHNNSKGAVYIIKEGESGVELEKEKRIWLINISPNPSYGVLNLEVHTQVNQPLKIDLYDLAGKVVKPVFNGVVRNELLLHLDFKGLSSGVYILKANEISKKVVLFERTTGKM
ncbi:FG-GAP repeat protein [candidate division WOR-3 bacterium]|nr:FG-GAP repeat protein [candidate division WOR-3 bacterium]